MTKIKIKSENKTPVKKKACETKRNQKEKTDFKGIILRFILFLQKALKKYSMDYKINAPTDGDEMIFRHADIFFSCLI